MKFVRLLDKLKLGYIDLGKPPKDQYHLNTVNLIIIEIDLDMFYTMALKYLP